MPGKAAKIVITERQEVLLRELAVGRRSEVRLAQRARIILLAFEKHTNEEISEVVGLNPDQVGCWRRRWQQRFNKLVAIECTESFDCLRKAIEDVLSDLPRSGRPAGITSEQQAQIISVACEVPEDSERPISQWTSEEIANEVTNRGIVPDISPRWVREILGRAKLQPHRSKYWLFSKDRDDADFDERVATICNTYHDSIFLYETQGIHTVCVDEQTGIQALERIAADLPARPGCIGKKEYEYIRHGTTGLFGNFHVPTGRILAPLLRDTRTEEDFLENLNNIIYTDVKGTWRLIVDNLNTHASESCVRYVADSCGIQTDLGKKGIRGILQSVASRCDFLTDPTHRIRFIYLPRHTSWLNQIEIWFGTLRKKLTRRGNFTSVQHLCDKITQFIDYYNETLAHPYNWTYRGRVLCE